MPHRIEVAGHLLRLGSWCLRDGTCSRLLKAGSHATKLNYKLTCPICGVIYLRIPHGMTNATVIHCSICNTALGNWREIEADFVAQGGLDGIFEMDQGQIIRERLTTTKRRRKRPGTHVTAAGWSRGPKGNQDQNSMFCPDYRHQPGLLHHCRWLEICPRHEPALVTVQSRSSIAIYFQPHFAGAARFGPGFLQLPDTAHRRPFGP